MTILKINAFTGMIPRLPPERLPDGAAEYAKNCDFSYGELRSLKGPGTKFSTTQAVRSLFTPDGTNYFTCPTRAAMRLLAATRTRRSTRRSSIWMALCFGRLM